MSIKNFSQKQVGIMYHKNFMNYKHTKNGKFSRFPHWNSFELENVFICPSGPTNSIDKVVKDVHQNIRLKTSRNNVSP